MDLTSLSLAGSTVRVLPGGGTMSAPSSCANDLNTRDGATGGKPLLVGGHEFSGTTKVLLVKLRCCDGAAARCCSHCSC